MGWDVDCRRYEEREDERFFSRMFAFAVPWPLDTAGKGAKVPRGVLRKEGGSGEGLLELRETERGRGPWACWWMEPGARGREEREAGAADDSLVRIVYGVCDVERVWRETGVVCKLTMLAAWAAEYGVLIKASKGLEKRVAL